MKSKSIDPDGVRVRYTEGESDESSLRDSPQGQRMGIRET
jgi:hypothetical protein